MAIEVPVDVSVSGLGPLEVLDERLDDIADPRTGTVGVDTSAATAATAALDKMLDEATEDRTAEVNVDVDGLNNLDRLRKSLDMSKERAEVLALEKALDAVTKARTANIDLEGTKEGQAKLAALDKALKAVERRRMVEVEVEVDSDPVENAMERLVAKSTRSSGAIGEAFSGAFQLIAKNAVILVAGIGVAFATLPAIGAIAASGLVLAFGGGIAGVGILAAAQSEKVKKAFGDMADGIVAEMKRIAAPLENVLVGISEDITRTFTNMTPTFEKAFADMAPALDRFSDNFFKAFEKLEPAVEPLNAAFTDLLDAIGPRLDGFFTNISDAVTNLSETISANPELFASMFVGLLNVIPTIINGIDGLARAFVFVYELVRDELGPAFEDFKTAFAPIGDLFSSATGGMSLFQVVAGAVGLVLLSVVRTISNVLELLTLVANAFRSAGAAIAATWQNTRTVTVNAWNAVRAAVTRALTNIRATVGRVLGSVRGVFSSSWAAIRGVVTRALAVIRGTVTGGMSRVRSVFSSAWSAIRSVVSRGVSAVRSAISSGLSSAVGAARNAWGRIRSVFSSGVSRALGIVRRLPGAILGIFSGLGGALFSSGYSMISGLASGIRAGFSAAISAASSGLSRLRSFFPFSPAKRGPFSGTGYTTYSGKALVEDFADSISKTARQVSPEVANALNPLANAFTAPDVSGRPAASPQGSTGTSAQPVATDALVAALASMFARMKFDISLGLDRRTTATLWLDGQRLAEVLQ